MDPYTYSNSSVLKNNFDIKDAATFDDAEADYTSLRLRELAERPLEGDYDLAHYLKMHQYIFQDLFEWAGKPRTINIVKEEPVLGGLSIEYSNHEDIKRDLVKAFDEIRDFDWAMSPDTLVTKLSKLIADVWKVHAFREGNTRVTITFFCQLVDEKFKKADRTIFEKNAAYVRTALVAYCANFGKDADYSKKEYLERIVGDAIGVKVA